MQRIILYHHPHCEKCRRMARVHRFFDWFGRVTISTDTPSTGPLVPGAIAVEDARTGQTVLGVKAVRWTYGAIPAYWALIPLLWIPAVARRIDHEVRGCTAWRCEVRAAGHRRHAEVQS